MYARPSLLLIRGGAMINDTWQIGFIMKTRGMANFTGINTVGVLRVYNIGVIPM